MIPDNIGADTSNYRIALMHRKKYIYLQQFHCVQKEIMEIIAKKCCGAVNLKLGIIHRSIWRTDPKEKKPTAFTRIVSRF